MKLSDHFALSEFMVSQTVARRGWHWPTVPHEVLNNLSRLALTIGEPLRELLDGRPVVVSSGWRFEALNRAVGGSRNSAHIDGRAMDITVPGVPLLQVAQAAHALEHCDKVIYEFGPSGWIHVQVAREGDEPRGRALCAYKARNALGMAQTCYDTGFEPPGGTWV